MKSIVSACDDFRGGIVEQGRRLWVASGLNGRERACSQKACKDTGSTSETNALHDFFLSISLEEMGLYCLCNVHLLIGQHQRSRCRYYNPTSP